MDDFIVYDDSFDKFYFMVEQGIVLGHIVSLRGLEVDKAIIYVILSLPYPSCVREVHVFLGHIGFYRYFIKDFSKITISLCKLLAKEVDFVFDQACKDAHNELKRWVTSTSIMQPPN